MLVLFLLGFFLLAYDLAGSFGTFVGQSAMTGVTHVDDKGWPGPHGQKQLSPQLAFFLNQPMPINSASLKDLVLLPGVGPHLARRIVLFRQHQGPIKNIVELEGIRGIGPKLVKKISPMIFFDSPRQIGKPCR